MNTPALKEWPLWEVFVRSKQGLEHKHCGSLHAADAPRRCTWPATFTPAARKA
jgi:1,2-phenylacetyl-CoA epoxidase PaaB subunit